MPLRITKESRPFARHNTQTAKALGIMHVIKLFGISDFVRLCCSCLVVINIAFVVLVIIFIFSLYILLLYLLFFIHSFICFCNTSIVADRTQKEISKKYTKNEPRGKPERGEKNKKQKQTRDARRAI